MGNRVMRCCLISLVILCFSHQTTAAPGVDWVEGQIIVKPRAGLSEDKLERILQRSNGRSKIRLQQIGVHVIKVPAQAEEAVIKALRNNPNIEYAEKDKLIPLSASEPNDTHFNLQWHLPRIEALTAWDDSAGENITVAILDTGVESSHPDLAANIVQGWNSASENTDTSPLGWHGTGVAGTVAAISNNSIGMSSVAWSANIMPVRVTNRSDGVATSSDLAAGILWAVEHGANIVNLSYDIEISVDNIVKDAAQYMRSQGGVVIASVGNANKDFGYADNPYIINVSATNENDVKASFSNYGAIVDISAPGKNIYTLQNNGGYAVAEGTSFASPVVAGVAALVMSVNPYLTPEEVEQVLEQSADDIANGSGMHPYYGHGRVNAAAAVALAKNYNNTDTQAPQASILSPGHHATVSGDVQIEVTASDNSGVSNVDLYIGGVLLGHDFTVPYLFTWDSTQVADGIVEIVAKAQDAAGNEGVSTALNLNVKNESDENDVEAPVITFLSPEDGSSVNRTVNINVTAQDNSGVTQVTIQVNGALLCATSGSENIGCSWNTRKVEDGFHQITAIAKDESGNEQTKTITVIKGGSSSGSSANKGRGGKK